MPNFHACTLATIHTVTSQALYYTKGMIASFNLTEYRVRALSSSRHHLFSHGQGINTSLVCKQSGV